jgi:hypothetical protein
MNTRRPVLLRVMQPLPEGLWGTPPEVVTTLPGYDPNVQKNRTQARLIMHKLGYGPDNRHGTGGKMQWKDGLGSNTATTTGDSPQRYTAKIPDTL